MTGLLHRLAQRATGSAWTVRSDLRLPFGAKGLEQPQDDAAAPLIQAPVAGAHATAWPRSAATTAPPAPTGPALAQQAEAVLPRAPMPPTREPAPMRAPLASAAPAQPSEAAGATAAAARAVAVPAIAAALHAPQRPRTLPPQGGAEPALLLPTQRNTAAHATPLHETVRGPGAFALRHHAPQSAAAGQETEVHIHIGRIEVTALHEAPAAKARQRERRPPVSLDAYLDARRSKP